MGKTRFSTCSVWVMKLLLDNEYHELEITGAHALAVCYLPTMHRDPFDRLLIAQAECEGLLLLTADHQVAQYPGPIRSV